MGIFSDLLVNSKTLDITIPTTALDKGVKREIDDIISRGDVEVPTSLQQRDAVQSILQYAIDPSGGTFTLTVTLRNGETFTTAAIAYDATAGTIETAIDTAANGTVTGWTDGDISVSGGTLLLAGADVVLTFDGTSVANINHTLTTIDGGSLTGGNADEIQDVELTGSPTGGTWELQLQLSGLAQIDVSGLAHDIAAATLETAIDSAANGVVPSWTDGDIAVSGTTVEDGTGLTLTFSGASVDDLDHGATTADISGLTGGTPAFVNTTTTPGSPLGGLVGTPQTTTTIGQTNRPSWAALISLSIATSSDVPDQGVDPVSFTSPGDPSFGIPSKDLIRLLADEASIEDDNLAVRDEILAAAGL